MLGKGNNDGARMRISKHPGSSNLRVSSFFFSFFSPLETWQVSGSFHAGELNRREIPRPGSGGVRGRAVTDPALCLVVSSPGGYKGWVGGFSRVFLYLGDGDVSVFGCPFGWLEKSSRRQTSLLPPAILLYALMPYFQDVFFARGKLARWG